MNRMNLQKFCVGSILVLCQLVVLCEGSTSEIFDVKPDKFEKFCFFVSNLNHSFIEYKKPYIELELLETKIEIDNELKKIDYMTNVILLNEKFLKFTNIANDEVDICIEEYIERGRCKEDQLNHALLEVDNSLDQEKAAIANILLSTVGDNVLNYQIFESGWYCLFLKPTLLITEGVDTSKVDQSLESVSIMVDIQQSFGELTISSYEEVEISIIMSWLYFIFGVSYFFYLYKNRKKQQNNNYSYESLGNGTTHGYDTNTTNTVSGNNNYNNKKNVTKLASIQTRLIFYVFISSALFMLTSIRYSIINKTSYSHDYLELALLHLIELSSGTFFTVWIIYQTLLISDGYILLSNFKSGLFSIYMIRVLIFILLGVFLIFDIEESTVFSIQDYLREYFRKSTLKNEEYIDINYAQGMIIYVLLFFIARQ
ncbi:hypothetical protein PACTADRAFT_3020 [Pachysolen tannophilus NRRL Y-2460]|uniref:PTM1-like N-terminal domain-containing protein n=1 Tax=Pachysolen tannophilus NRRL Y-2460 TaxID=669874 RepID=A0A1E4TUC0_PACTA|nr:hypothetical protein PACTADRAFT_3020 [Pachysolen tannophilus NRRL Y-2460]